MSDIDLYLNPAQVDPSPTHPVVVFRPHPTSHTSSMCRGKYWQAPDPANNNSTLKDSPLKDSCIEIMVYSYSQLASRVNYTHNRGNSIEDSTTTGECSNPQETFLEH